MLLTLRRIYRARANNRQRFRKPSVTQNADIVSLFLFHRTLPNASLSKHHRGLGPTIIAKMVNQ